MSDKKNKSLKPGWRQVKFGDVVQLSKARSQDPLGEGIERYVGLEHLEPGDLRIRSWGNVADGVTFTSVFKPGQVLFGKRRAYQRKVAVADFSGVCSGDIYVLETKDPKVLLPELLPFICQTDAFFDHAVGTSAGSLSPRTNWTSLADFKFALPPLDEQRALLDVLQQIEDAIETTLLLQAAAINLAKSQIADDFSMLQQVQIGTVCKFRGGNAFSPQMQGRKSGEIPFIKVSDMNLPANRSRILEAENYVDADDLQKMRAKPFEAGSVVFAKVGAALFLNRRRIIAAPTCIDNNMMGAIPDISKITSEYLYLVLQQIDFKTIVQEGAIPSVNQGTIEKVMIPFTTLERQEEIVFRWHQTNEAIQKINARIEAHQQLKRQALILVGGGHH